MDDIASIVPAAPVTQAAFASFWAGRRISAFEAACLASFVRHNHTIVVFSFDAIENLPDGVTLRDAGELLEESATRRFLINGKPSLSHFSDYFRYKLFAQTDFVWVDMDMLLLRPLDLAAGVSVLAKEEPRSLCGAIMRIDRTAPQLPDLVRRTEACMDRDLIWGETGPRLLTRLFGRDLLAQAHAPETFFPIHYTTIWKAFLPEFRDACAELCRNAYTVHLWNNIIDRIGIWKRFAPPAGSFLAERFAEDSSLELFDGTYPLGVMRAMLENWQLRHSGGDLSLGQLSRQVVPAIGITARKHIGNIRTAL